MQTGERKGRHEATHHKLRHMIGEADAVADAVLDGEPESKFALFTKSLRSYDDDHLGSCLLALEENWCLA